MVFLNALLQWFLVDPLLWCTTRKTTHFSFPQFDLINPHIYKVSKLCALAFQILLSPCKCYPVIQCSRNLTHSPTSALISCLIVPNSNLVVPAKKPCWYSRFWESFLSHTVSFASSFFRAYELGMDMKTWSNLLIPKITIVSHSCLTMAIVA